MHVEGWIPNKFFINYIQFKFCTFVQKSLCGLMVLKWKGKMISLVIDENIFQRDTKLL